MHQRAKQPSHFEGKNPLEHVIHARRKGQNASDEIHGAEMPGHLSAFADTAKETSLVLALFYSMFTTFAIPSWNMHWMLTLFLLGWLLWKTARSALLGYARLERMHRVIEEERWEIEHHREQEREELTALYSAKGFSGNLLNEVIDILMADDNRLLQVMLHEELGFQMESLEHPLKQATGAALGVILPGILLALSLFYFPSPGTLFTAFFLIALSAGFAAKLQKNRIIPALLWNVGCAALVLTAARCASQLLFSS